MKKNLSALVITGLVGFSLSTISVSAAHPVKTTTAAFGTPIIDEQAVDSIWNSVEPITMFQAKRGEITEDTAFPSVKTMWDNEYVYILAEVEDSEIYKNEVTLHESDYTELYFNPLKDRENDTYDDSEFWIKIHPDGTLESHANAPEGIISTAFVTDTGYVTQVKIPHELYTAEEGETIGFDLQIGNASAATGKRDIILGWNDTINSAYKNPAVVGELVFGEAVNPLIGKTSTPLELFIPAVNQEVKVTENGHVVKTMNAFYGSPEITADATAVDPIWNSISAATDFHAKTGELISPTAIKAMWNEEFIYFLTEVSDPEIFKANSSAIHESDNTELYLDPNLSRAASYDNDDVWIKIFPDGFTQGHANMPEGTVTNSIITETGYITQYKIPFAATAAQTIGFDIQINDGDEATGKRHSILGWNDTTGDTWKTLETVGELYFAPATSNPVQPRAAVTTSTATLSSGEEHPVKNIEVAYGTPASFATAEALDPAWDNASSIFDFHAKKGEITPDSELSSVDLLWDEEYLHILAIVDDTEIFKNEATLHESDYVELYFNPLIDRSNGKYDKEEFWIKIHPDGTFESHANAPEGIESSAVIVEGGYIAEAKIPHTLYTAEPGATIGFDLQIGDASAATMMRDTIMGWNDTINSAWKNPDVVGTLTFLAKDAIPQNIAAPISATKKEPEGPVVIPTPVVTVSDRKISSGQTIPVKHTTVVYGTPKFDANTTSMDPVWDKATEITDLRAKRGEITEDTDMSTIKLMWDEKFLYVMGVITDSEIFRKDESPGDGDNLEMFFNPLVDRSNGAYDTNEFWIKVYPNGDIESNANIPEGVVASAYLTKDGYVVQTKIPHTAYEPKAGTTIGFDFQVNNGSADINTRHTILGWNDTLNAAYANPDVVGELTLMGKRGEFGDYVPAATKVESIPAIPLEPAIIIEPLPDPIPAVAMPVVNFDASEAVVWKVSGTPETSANVVAIEGNRAVQVAMGARQADGIGMSTLTLEPEADAWTLGENNTIAATIINPSSDVAVQVRMKITDHFGNEKMNYFTVEPATIKVVNAVLGEAGVAESDWSGLDGHAGKGVDKTQITKIEFYIPEDMLDVMPGVKSAAFIIDSVRGE